MQLPAIAERPNFVMFMPDQLRFDSLGCNGNKYVKTPNIDKFAQNGTQLLNMYEQHSVCSQSRCSMFTSKYPHVTGHRGIKSLIQPWEPNFFRTLKENGYHVAVLAPRGDLYAPEVTELCVDEYGFLESPDAMPDFDYNDDTDHHTLMERLYYEGKRDAKRAVDYDEAAVRSAEKWLSCPPDDAPWVLFLPLIFPHPPFTVEEPYFSMYDRSKMPAPTLPEDKTGYEPKYMKRMRELLGTERCTLETWQEIKATYFGMISRLDDQFGRVMDTINSRPALSSSTITLFFTDHGEYMGDHGLVEKWPAGVSENLVHSPFLVSGPGIPRGGVIDSMAEMIDLGPTVFELAKITDAFQNNGKSLVPVINSQSTSHREYAFSEGGFLYSEEPIIEHAGFPYDLKANLQHDELDTVGRCLAIRSKEWTYIYRLYEPCELYSRVHDLDELYNLASNPEYDHIVRKFESIMLRWMIETSDHAPMHNDPRFPEVNLPSPKEQYERRKRNN